MKQDEIDTMWQQTMHKSIEAAIRAERQRIVNLLMIQHEMAKGSHNYWQVAANLIKEQA